MNHSEYLKTYLNSRVDYDWSYWYQCVDLIRHYYHQVYAYALWVFGGSAYAWRLNEANTFPKKDFRKIENKYGDTTNYPTIGDVIFFAPNPANGNYGHVAIVDSADWYNLIVLEQNGARNSGTGTGADAVRLQQYGYLHVLWWYTPLFVNPTTQEQIDAEGAKRMQEMGIRNGKNPDRPITRRETAVMLDRFYRLLS